MRIVVAVVLFLGACAHGAAVDPAAEASEREWDTFCMNPPPDQQRWCSERAQQRQMQLQRQALEEQRAENARAEKHRRFERSQAVWNASQAPYQQKN